MELLIIPVLLRMPMGKSQRARPSMKFLHYVENRTIIWQLTMTTLIPWLPAYKVFLS